LSEQRKYRKFAAQQKLEIVLAGLRGDRSVRDDNLPEVTFRLGSCSVSTAARSQKRMGVGW